MATSISFTGKDLEDINQQIRDYLGQYEIAREPHADPRQKVYPNPNELGQGEPRLLEALHYLIEHGAVGHDRFQRDMSFGGLRARLVYDKIRDASNKMDPAYLKAWIEQIQFDKYQEEE